MEEQVLKEWDMVIDELDSDSDNSLFDLDVFQPLKRVWKSNKQKKQLSQEEKEWKQKKKE